MQAGGICPVSGQKELDRIQETARHSGLPPALECLLEGRDRFGPAGYGMRPDGQDGRSSAAGPAVVRRCAVPGGAVLVIRTTSAGGPGVDQDGLLRARLGLVQGLRSACTARLGARASAEGVLLGRQLVQGQLAAAFAAEQEIAARLDEGAPLTKGDRRCLHAGLTRAGRSLLRLYGAASYLTDGPGATMHCSELLADVYADVHPAAGDLG